MFFFFQIKQLFLLENKIDYYNSKNSPRIQSTAPWCIMQPSSLKGRLWMLSKKFLQRHCTKHTTHDASTKHPTQTKWILFWRNLMELTPQQSCNIKYVRSVNHQNWHNTFPFWITELQHLIVHNDPQENYDEVFQKLKTYL